MRTCVAARGAVGATLTMWRARQGVSRGLLHYYFGTKERLLAEVVRRDCDLRMARLSEDLRGGRATTPKTLLVAAAGSLEQMGADEPEVHGAPAPTCTRRRGATRRSRARSRSCTGACASTWPGLLGGRAGRGRAVELAASPEVVSEVLFSLADGLGMRMLVEPERDFGATVGAALLAAGALVRPR